MPPLLVVELVLMHDLSLFSVTELDICTVSELGLLNGRGITVVSDPDFSDWDVVTCEHGCDDSARTRSGFEKLPSSCPIWSSDW